jgi:hypothetical protein
MPPSIRHEAVVEVLRNEPGLLVLLLARLGVQLPSGASPILADSNLSSRDPDLPKTLLADNVFLFQEPGKRIAVVAEVQTAPPGHPRSLAWPAYVTNARSIYGCDTILFVIGLTAAAVKGSSKTILTGHPYFDLSPKVTGHGLLPGPGGRDFGSELTVLHVMTGELNLSTHDGRMFALVSLAYMPDERRERYTRFIRAVVPGSARKELTELMRTVIKDPFMDGLLAQGEAKGEARGEARMLMRYLDSKFDVPEGRREQITACTDMGQLEAWFDRAIIAGTLDEVFTE